MIKMDSVEDSLRLANQYHESSQSSGDEGAKDNNGSYSSYFRLYEYQIVEMQHEYELLLEDKVTYFWLEPFILSCSLRYRRLCLYKMWPLEWRFLFQPFFTFSN